VVGATVSAWSECSSASGAHKSSASVRAAFERLDTADPWGKVHVHIIIHPLRSSSALLAVHCKRKARQRCDPDSPSTHHDARI